LKKKHGPALEDDGSPPSREGDVEPFSLLAPCVTGEGENEIGLPTMRDEVALSFHYP